MALSAKEFERLNSLVQERQNPDLSKFSASGESSAFSRVSNTIKKAGDNVYGAISGTGQFEGQSPVRRGFEATAQAFNAVPKVALDVMPEPVRNVAGKVGEVVGKGFSALTDKIGDSKQLQDWVLNNPEAAKNLEEVLGVSSASGQIAGDILLANQVAKAPSQIADVSKKVVDKFRGSSDISNAVDKVANPSLVSRVKTKVGDSKIVNKAQDTITPIEKGVKNVFTKSTTPKPELQSKFKSYTEQGQKALEDYSQKTPLEMAGEKAQSSLNKIKSQMTEVGTNKSAITQKLSGTRVNARPFVKELVETVKTRLNLTPTKKGFVESAGRISKVSDKADIKLLNEVTKTLNKAKTFKQLDDAVDFAQDLLFKRTGVSAVPINTQVQGILKGVIKKANDHLKTVGGNQYKDLNVQYANRVQVYNKLNKALGTEGNKGASLMKQLFSPSGTAPRKLFEAVKKFTGDDLVEEATIAKFVMENIGDVRQASLLEQVIRGQATTKSGIIGIAADKILQKLQDPIGKAERLIDKSTSSLP